TLQTGMATGWRPSRQHVTKLTGHISVGRDCCHYLTDKQVERLSDHLLGRFGRGNVGRAVGRPGRVSSTGTHGHFGRRTGNGVPGRFGLVSVEGFLGRFGRIAQGSFMYSGTYRINFSSTIGTMFAGVRFVRES